MGSQIQVLVPQLPLLHQARVRRLRLPAPLQLRPQPLLLLPRPLPLRPLLPVLPRQVLLPLVLLLLLLQQVHLLPPPMRLQPVLHLLLLILVLVEGIGMVTTGMGEDLHSTPTELKYLM